MAPDIAWSCEDHRGNGLVGEERRRNERESGGEPYRAEECQPETS